MKRMDAILYPLPFPLIFSLLLFYSIDNANLEKCSTIKQGAKMFADSLSSGTPVTGILRQPVYLAAIRADPAGAVAALKKEWFTTTTADAKDAILQTIGSTADASIVSSLLLPFMFNSHPPAPAEDSVATSDMFFMANSFAENRIARPLLWRIRKENWDKLLAKIGGNLILLDRVLNFALPKFTDHETLADIEKFFSAVDTKGFDRTLEKAKDIIRPAQRTGRETPPAWRNGFRAMDIRRLRGARVGSPFGCAFRRVEIVLLGGGVVLVMPRSKDPHLAWASCGGSLTPTRAFWLELVEALPLGNFQDEALSCIGC